MYNIKSSLELPISFEEEFQLSEKSEAVYFDEARFLGKKKSDLGENLKNRVESPKHEGVIRGQLNKEFSGCIREFNSLVLQVLNSVDRELKKKKADLFELNKLDEKLEFSGGNNFAGHKLENLTISSWKEMKNFLNSDKFEEYVQLSDRLENYKKITDWIDGVYGSLPNRHSSYHKDKILYTVYKDRSLVLSAIKEE